MSIFTSTEIGSPANQASQRAIRNGWMASIFHVILAFSYGGFYQPTWLTGNMIEGVVFAVMALTVPITMAVIGITSYKLHYRKLMQEQTKLNDPLFQPETLVAAE
ncbi:hypothetical protein [Curvivirga aplysinae]|uniref:hypothetical protein n=1 Tax=Curvivirga aplysinae TaxID=2529852 RepID=UPI0012BD3D56|nr:hypothetical protein [Curvivirga aplysinae]MTI08642.1 hypothetical protein [Curvivirga aplysinae]